MGERLVNQIWKVFIRIWILPLTIPIFWFHRRIPNVVSSGGLERGPVQGGCIPSSRQVRKVGVRPSSKWIHPEVTFILKSSSEINFKVDPWGNNVQVGRFERGPLQSGSMTNSRQGQKVGVRCTSRWTHDEVTLILESSSEAHFKVDPWQRNVKVGISTWHLDWLGSVSVSHNVWQSFEWPFGIWIHPRLTTRRFVCYETVKLIHLSIFLFGTGTHDSREEWSSEVRPTSKWIHPEFTSSSEGWSEAHLKVDPSRSIVKVGRSKWHLSSELGDETREKRKDTRVTSRCQRSKSKVSNCPMLRRTIRRQTYDDGWIRTRHEWYVSERKTTKHVHITWHPWKNTRQLTRFQSRSLYKNNRPSHGTRSLTNIPQASVSHILQ